MRIWSRNAPRGKFLIGIDQDAANLSGRKCNHLLGSKYPKRPPGSYLFTGASRLRTLLQQSFLTGVHGAALSAGKSTDGAAVSCLFSVFGTDTCASSGIPACCTDTGSNATTHSRCTPSCICQLWQVRCVAHGRCSDRAEMAAEQSRIDLSYTSCCYLSRPA